MLLNGQIHWGERRNYWIQQWDHHHENSLQDLVEQWEVGKPTSVDCRMLHTLPKVGGPSVIQISNRHLLGTFEKNCLHSCLPLPYHVLTRSLGTLASASTVTGFSRKCSYLLRPSEARDVWVPPFSSDCFYPWDSRKLLLIFWLFLLWGKLPLPSPKSQCPPRVFLSSSSLL